MTLDEAIKNAKEVADEKWEEACNFYESGHIKETREYIECVKAHRQLAEWLKELKQLREQTRWIHVSERLPEDSGDYFVWIKPEGEKPYVSIEDIDCDGMVKKWNTIYAYGIVAWMPLPQPYRTESEGEE